MSVINITEDQMKRFQRIRDSRPQDSKARDTFDYILRVFEESPLRITEKNHPSQRNAIAGNAASPIIITPITMAEKLYADKKRRDALKAANAAPIKNMSYQESKE
jgi:hypothetical protein